MKHSRVMLAAATAVCLSASVWAQSGSRMSGHANALTSQEQKEGWMLLFSPTAVVEPLRILSARGIEEVEV